MTYLRYRQAFASSVLLATNVAAYAVDSIAIDLSEDSGEYTTVNELSESSVIYDLNGQRQAVTYELEVEENSEYNQLTISLTAEFDTYLYAISPSGEIFFNDDTTNSSDSALLIMDPAPGDWVLFASSFAAISNRQEFELSVSFNQAEKPNLIELIDGTNTLRIDGLLTPNSPSYQLNGSRHAIPYRLIVPEDNTYDFLEISLAADFDAYLFVETPNERNYFNDDFGDSSNSTLTLQSLVPGEYTIYAASYNNVLNATDFTLALVSGESIEYNETLVLDANEQTPELEAHQSVHILSPRNSYCEQTQMPAHFFELEIDTIGDTLGIAVNSTNYVLAPVVHLIAPDGTLQTPEVYHSSSYSQEIDQIGTWTAIVTSNELIHEECAYTLTVQRGPEDLITHGNTNLDFVSGQVLEIECVINSLNPVNHFGVSYQNYQISNVPENGYIIIKPHDMDTYENLNFQITSPTGRLFHGYGLTFDDQGTISLPVNEVGTWQIEVSSYAQTETVFNFTLSMQAYSIVETGSYTVDLTDLSQLGVDPQTGAHYSSFEVELEAGQALRLSPENYSSDLALSVWMPDNSFPTSHNHFSLRDNFCVISEEVGTATAYLSFNSAYGRLLSNMTVNYEILGTAPIQENSVEEIPTEPTEEETVEAH